MSGDASGSGSPPQPTPVTDFLGRYDLDMLSEGARRIVRERDRQLLLPSEGGKGWQPSHDHEHTKGELVHAARAYASVYNLPSSITANVHTADAAGWPWSDGWKPSDDPIRNLEKAGALIAAEIDRLLFERRVEALPPGSDLFASEGRIMRPQVIDTPEVPDASA